MLGSGIHHGVDVTVGLSVGHAEPVRLRVLDDGCVALTIGRGFEAFLAEPHLVSLAEQIGPALAHLRSEVDHDGG